MVSEKNGVAGKVPKSTYSNEEQIEPKVTFLVHIFSFFFILLFYKLDLETISV